MVGSLASSRIVDNRPACGQGIEILVVGAQRVDRTGQHRHRVGVAREAVEESRLVFMQQRVPLDLRGERGQLLGGGQLAVDQQVADLDEGRLLGQLIDRVAAVTQDPGVAVDVGDGALGRRGVHKPLVEGRVAGLGQQRAERVPSEPSVAWTISGPTLRRGTGGRRCRRSGHINLLACSAPASRPCRGHATARSK